MVSEVTNIQLKNTIRETELWYRIRKAAETDSVLKTMLEEVVLYFQLKYDGNNETDNCV